MRSSTRQPGLYVRGRARSQAQARPDLGVGKAHRILRVHARRQRDDDAFGDLLEAGAEMGRALDPDDGARAEVEAEMREGLAMDRLLTDRIDDPLDAVLGQKRGRAHLGL